MNVLIDCTQITRNKAGVGVYALNLIREVLGEQDSDMQVTLLVQDDDPDFLFCQEGVRIVKVKSSFFRLMPFRLLMEQLYIPWLTRKYKIDLLHSLHFSFPLLRTRARKIVTVHDMTSFIMPEVHVRIKIAYFHFFLRAANRFADALIFVSRSTEDDWRRYFPKYSKSSFVIPLGKSPSFRPDLSEREINLAFQKYKLIKPYVLYVGTIEPRKNLARLVTAFAQVAQFFPNHTLVIAGMKGWMYNELFQAVESLSLESKVIFTGFVAEEDKPYLIAGAEVFIYPSLYEGFGIPVLEAMACGTPTITSNISSLPEVAGDAALLVDPRDVDGLALNLRRLLTDPALRASLRQKSAFQASLFSWKRTADLTVEAYRTVVHEKLARSEMHSASV